MRKTILHWLSILAGISFFIISLQGVQEHAATYALNNDNITALFHIEQAAEQGLAHLLRINWARIPSLLPDYGVAAVANHLGSSLNQKFVLSCLLQSCLGIVSVYLLLRSVMPKRNIDWILIPLLSYGGLLMASSGFRQLALLATLPVNHGGNWITTSLFLAYLLNRIGKIRSVAPITEVAIAMLAMAATFSNRLFVLTALLPPLLIQWAPPQLVPYRKKLFPLRKMMGSATVGAMLGCLVYFLLPHQCSDNLAGTFDVREIISVLATRHGAIALLLIPAMMWMAFRLTCTNALDLRNSDIARRYLLGDCMLLMLVASGLVYPWIARGEADAIYLRYLLTPVMLAPALIALTVLGVFSIHYPATLPHRAAITTMALAGTIGFGSVFVADSGLNRSFLDLADKSLLRKLPTIIRQHCGGGPCVILATNPPFNALRLNLEMAGSGNRVLEVSGHGDPLIFWMSRSDYYREGQFHRSDPSKGLIVSNLIATGKDQLSSVENSLGMPSGLITLDRAGHVLLTYSSDERVRQKAKLYFASQSQLPFCIPNNIRESLLKLRTFLRSNGALPGNLPSTRNK